MDVHKKESKLGTLLAAGGGLTASVHSMGITLRLSISLIAVVILAAAANLIAREGASIILVGVNPTLQTAPRIITLPPQLPPQLPRQAAAPPVDKSGLERKRIESLNAAVERFETATRLRAAQNSEKSDAEFKRARDDLKRIGTDESHRAVNLSRAANPDPAAKPSRTAKISVSHGADALDQRVGDYIGSAARVVTEADQRRDARAAQVLRLDSMSRRLQVSLDSAWTIFGRVIARQSLVQLRADLDAIRLHSENTTSGDAPSASLDALIASENNFASTFATHEAGFVKSEGSAWVQQMHSDFEAMAAARGLFMTTNTRYETAQNALSRQRALLSDALWSSVVTALSPPELVSAGDRGLADPGGYIDHRGEATLTGGADAGLSNADSEGTSPAIGNAVAGDVGPGIGNAHSSSAGITVPVAPGPNLHGDRKSRSLIGGITAAVLLLITAIAVLTVRSIVGPVRNILKATAQLAEGGTPLPVARGGIKELDTLAAAFNDMAERLMAAREATRNQQASLEEKVLERTHKLQKLAQQDPLTSLPNRRHLSALLSGAIERAALKGRYVGVYFIDIDNFKNFNDSQGHVFGDRVLMSVANRLEEVTDGHGFVARLGGDEFTVVYEDAESIEEVHEMGEKLVRAFHTLVSVDDRELSISASVGASIFPTHNSDAEGLLRAADSALFRAKELGRSQLAVFTPELIETAAARFSIEQGLRRALEHGEFELAYQPEINLLNLETGLVEALLRWKMPDGHMARPGEFLAVAEQSGLIAEISDWVLRQAVHDAARWYRGGWPEVRVAINISPRQLLGPRFIEQILALLAEHRLPPQCIELELTETVMQTGPATIAALRVLRSHGFGIALDDFGTGYSSLTSLEQLPLTRIKLDRSLIASIDFSPRSAAIARAIIDLCAGLELEVTAEGIERPEQLAWLVGNRNMFVQGFLFAQGVPFDDLLAVKSSLTARIQDLLLSLPAQSDQRESVIAPARVANG